MHKNIWKFWSLFCVTGAVIFILIPQIWIAFSSLLRTSGNFTLELNNDKINIIDADLEGFRVINDNQNKIRENQNMLNLLKSIYGKDDFNQITKQLNNNELEELCKNLTNGIPKEPSA